MSSIGIEDNLKEENIGFGSFTGDALCRMAYGFDINPSKTITSNFIEESGFSALKDRTQVNVYAVSAPESTEQLDERYNRLALLPDGLREIEDERIALHYHISRKASSTKYYISVGMPDHDQDISDVAALFEENAVVIGGDIIQEVVNSHLTPGAKMCRGKK